jgi:hypothetical protein
MTPPEPDLRRVDPWRRCGQSRGPVRARPRTGGSRAATRYGHVPPPWYGQAPPPATDRRRRFVTDGADRRWSDHIADPQGIGFPCPWAAQAITKRGRTCGLSWERVEGVSCSLPYSDLLALTSSHMFLSAMN